MKVLAIFAHPDDETVACGGTFCQLIKDGHEVVVVSVTDGGAGEISSAAEVAVAKLGSLNAVRRQEFKKVCDHLGVAAQRILDFQDGEITNKVVWGDLTVACIELIDEIKPNIIITFDHSGWYFHLDHVGVSIAVTVAVQQAAHRPDLYFQTFVKASGTKWRYVFNPRPAITHLVDVTAYKEMKAKAYDLHQSQDLNTPREWLESRSPYYEWFQLISASDMGKSWLKAQSIFQKVTASKIRQLW
ncbi:MAG: PIG-L family deacetylase [bacterium]|nr:PIG-L family deacetylase [bacterium]